MNQKIIYLLFIISILFSQENASDSTYVGLVTKEEMTTWAEKYPKTIAIGFGSCSPINNNLLAFSERGQSKNKWFFLKLNNYYNMNLFNKEINFSLIGGTENFYLLNMINVWNIFNHKIYDVINIGVGPGATIVLHKFEYQETAFGLIFDLNTTIPLNIYNINSTIGLNVKHIFTSYEKIDELEPYNSQVFNFYIDFKLPTDKFPL
jgi:hypothetical protein